MRPLPAFIWSDRNVLLVSKNLLCFWLMIKILKPGTYLIFLKNHVSDYSSKAGIKVSDKKKPPSFY
jgi:hypothetical protein